MKKVGTCILDTLQIYFPWDDDLYTNLKQKGLGTENSKKKSLPLIYTDNCSSTVGKEKLQRNYVLDPSYFDETFSNLGWVANEKNKARPIIPSEKIQSEICISDDYKNLLISIIPRINGKEEYHIEYSSRASFGKMYTNWVTLYYKFDDFQQIMKSIISLAGASLHDLRTIHTEKKQNQREEFDYVQIPVSSYKFSLSEFKYAEKYLRHNGVKGQIPSLQFDSKNELHT